MFNEEKLEDRKQRTGVYHFCSLFSIHSSLITLFVLFLAFTGNAQPSYFRTSKPGWERWETDTAYYDSTGVIKTIYSHKMKSKSLRSTTKIVKHKITEFDVNGNWYSKRKFRTNAGCFHFKQRTIWKRTREKYVPFGETV